MQQLYRNMKREKVRCGGTFKKDPHLRFTVLYSAEYHLPALSGKNTPSFDVFKESEL